MADQLPNSFQLLVTHLKKMGVTKGVFRVPNDIDIHNDAVARLFLGKQI
jgi:hypothetical protein